MRVRDRTVRYPTTTIILLITVTIIGIIFITSCFQLDPRQKAFKIISQNLQNQRKPDRNVNDDSTSSSHQKATEGEESGPKSKPKEADQEADHQTNKDKKKEEEVGKNDETEKKPFFKGGRTFEHLYSKSLKSPLYEKEFPHVEADVEKQDAVKEAFLHAWNNYDKHCFGSDEYHPLSTGCGSHINSGLTIVDSISTIIIMGLEEPYRKVRNFVDKEFRPNGSWSLFEFIIRILGGMISAASLSNDPIFNDAAIALGDALFPIMRESGGFYSTNFRIKSQDRNKFEANGGGGGFCLAEYGTFQVEFFKLAEMTGESRFIKPAMNVYQKVWRESMEKGLVSSSVGAGDDSYYEYIIKNYILTGGISDEFLNRHLMIIRDIKENLVFKTIHQGLVGIGTKSLPREPHPMMEHLATFAGGMIGLGTVKKNPKSDEDLKLGGDLAKTYATVYNGFKSGIMPERVMYNTDKKDKEEDFWMVSDGYILRPETVESIYVMWKFTGDEIYRKYNWRIFKAINRTCRTPHGFASIHGLNGKDPSHSDTMESFFLAETLKYLYLTFCDSSLISPVEWVFNTEAHPVHVWQTETIEKFRKLIDINLTDPETDYKTYNQEEMKMGINKERAEKEAQRFLSESQIRHEKAKERRAARKSFREREMMRRAKINETKTNEKDNNDSIEKDDKTKEKSSQEEKTTKQ